MDLAELICEDLIKTDLHSVTRDEAVAELLDLLVQTHEIRIIHRQQLLEEIIKREKSYSTGIGDGVALPHVKTHLVSDIITAVGISAEGISFDSVDGEVVHIVILMLIPHENYSKYLKTLADVARMLKKEEFRRKLIGAKNPSEVMKAVELESES